MLETIKLDDRDFDDIRDEAVANIIKHCPEWTNHNASDPGITLIELFSSMSEMILYRLNQVPEKNYLAFLDLIGIKQRLPVPSTAKVLINLSRGYQNGNHKKDTILLKNGSLITSEPKIDEDAIIFETTKDIYLSNIKLLNVYSKKFNEYRQRDEILNHTKEVENKEPFYPFNVDGNSTNSVEICVYSDEFNIFQNDVKVTFMFRLPTTMREHKISKDFLKRMEWKFFDGFNWQNLNILPNYQVVLDTKDADVIAVTFDGNNNEFEKGIIDRFSEDENFYLKGIFKEIPEWLTKLTVYEVSLVASSNSDGILPQNSFHNYEQLDMNNNFYPFGARPKLDNKLLDEVFTIRSDEAFSDIGSTVSIEIQFSTNSEYLMPKGSTNLQIAWEYPIDIGKWNLLEIEDNTDGFIKNGTVVFQVPKDIVNIALNGEEGFWIRARILAGNFGEEEKTEYNDKTGEITTIPSSLRPPLLAKTLVHYTLVRKDLENCFILHNFKYNTVNFKKNQPTHLFESGYAHEEALFLAFDSFLSDEYLDLYFDIDNDLIENRNIHTKQRILEWEFLQNGKWVTLNIEDDTDALTKSGDVRIELPIIEKLEKFIVYMEKYDRLWIKIKIKFNALSNFPKINNILVNSVDVTQKETFFNELIGKSNGLPNMRFKLNYKNLIAPPKIFIGDDEYKPVDRLVDYSKDDKVFRFNGITGEIEFGDGIYGVIPDLGESIIAKEYAITQGKDGNLKQDKLTVLRESLNYVDSLTNMAKCSGGENGDTLNDLKKYAPTVLKTMDRAVTIEDYQLLAENYSPFIKKTKCIYKDGEIIIIVMTKNILESNGFINTNLLENLEDYLLERSLITIHPIVIAPKIFNLRIYLKLKFTTEGYSFLESELKMQLLETAKKYFNPFSGYNGNGYPIARDISKGDMHNIINATDSNFYLSEIKFQKVGSKDLIQRLSLSYDELINLADIVLEDISYDI